MEGPINRSLWEADSFFNILLRSRALLGFIEQRLVIEGGEVERHVVARPRS
jgi:hypothetical protein